MATGDIDGDRKLDIITSPGAGRLGEVRIFDGDTRAPLTSFIAFDAAYKGGVYVAAGDVNGDGTADVFGGSASGTITQLALHLGATNVAHADAGPTSTLVTPTAVSSNTAASDFFPVGQLIDNSGLSGTATVANLDTISHADASQGDVSWVTADPGDDYFAAGGPTPVLTFDLGGTFVLTDLVLWGYTFFTANNNEAKSFTVEFSTDGGVTFTDSVDVTKTARSDNAAATLSFGGPFIANVVRVSITDNFFAAEGALGGDRVGLGEVKFVALA